MPLPSSTFNVADWSTSNVSIDDVSAGLIVTGSISRGSPNITASGGYVRLKSSDGIRSTVRYAVPVEAIHTLEFEAKFETLPSSVELLESSRFYIGVLDAQGGTAGVLVARDGIAIAGNPDAEMTALAGSAGLLPPAGSTVTVRLVVNARGGTAAIYVTLTSQLTATGHILRRTVKLPKAQGRYGDMVYVEALGEGDNAVDVYVKVLRLGNGLVVPGRRPIAKIAALSTVSLGTTTRLDGEESYIPASSAALSYVWRVVRKPASSTMLLTGHEEASVDHGDARITSLVTGSGGNGQTIQFVDPGLNPANDTLELGLSGSTIVVTLKHSDSGVSGRTTAGDLVAALTSISDPAYNPDVSELVTAEVVGDEDDILTAGTITLTDGSDSTETKPLFTADADGTYTFGLTVSSSELTSEEALVTINCLKSAVAIGRTPETRFVWDYLSDVYQLVDGKDAFEAVWRALIRLTASELTRLWQIDRSKSLSTISPQMQHKWVSFDAVYEPAVSSLSLVDTFDAIGAYPLEDRDGDLTTTLIRHSSAGVVPEGSAILLYVNGGPVVTRVKKWTPLRTSSSAGSTTDSSDVLTYTGFNGSSIRAGEAVLISIGGTYESFSVKAVVSDTQLRLDRAVGVTLAGSATFQVGGVCLLEDDVVPLYLLIDEGDQNGRATDDGAGSQSTTAWFALSHGAFAGGDYAAGDKLLLEGVSSVYPSDLPVINAVVDVLQLGTEVSIEIDAVSWQVVRYIGTTQISVNFTKAIELEADAESLSPGDVIRFSSASTGDYAGVGVVRAVNGDLVALASAVEDGDYGISFRRIVALEAGDTVEDIPRLQYELDQDNWLTSAADYSVAAGVIEFTPDGGTDGAVDEDGVFTSSQVELNHDSVGLAVVVYDTANNKPAGVYEISSVDEDGAATLSSPPAASSSLTFKIQPIPFSTLVAAAFRWWAEYVYTNNSETIEANFGTSVGLAASDIESGSAEEYLNAVRALHFALWSGPTVANIRLGVNAIMGLPFTEVAGVVVEIDTTSSSSGHRMLIADSVDSRVIRTYRYPADAELATNPETGETIREGDELGAFIALTKSASVLDYINSPDWYVHFLSGASVLQKFHTFLVTADLSLANSRMMPIVRAFLERIKPKHTDYILAGNETTDDDIDIVDDVSFSGGLVHEDSLYSTPDGAVLSGSLVSATATTTVLDSEASPVAGAYTGMYIRAVYVGQTQVAEITGYAADRTVTVAAWPLGTPAASSAYSVLNPPPFPAGVTSGLDRYDGRGNWDMASQRELHPTGGADPTAIVVVSALSGVLITGENVRLAAGQFIGKVRAVHGSTVYLRVQGGSVPNAADQLRGEVSGVTATVVSAAIGQWPSYSYVNRHRSELWIPLTTNTLRGPAYVTTTVSAYTALGGSGGPELQVAATAAAHTYVNYRTTVGGVTARVISHDGTTLFLSGNISASVGNSCTLHPPKPRCRLLGLNYFEPGSTVIGQTSGHRAEVYYFGPSYLLLRNCDRNPYSSFVRGETIVGENGEQGVALSEPFYVFADALNKLNRGDSLEVHPEEHVCVYAGVNGIDPALNMGLRLNDVELFQKPYDPMVATRDQYVPSHGPGLYFWVDKKVAYGHVDASTAGPDASEPPWVPSPSVPIGTVSTDPGWNANVVHDTGICRVIASDGEPAIGATVPEPAIMSVL